MSKKEETQSTILDAAERAINAKGIANTKISDIAKEAGVSKGGVFHHFPTKKSVILGIIDRYEKTLYSLRDEIHGELPEQPFRKLKATLLALIKHPNHSNNDTANIITLLSDAELRHKIGRVKKNLFNDVMADAPDPKRAALAMIFYDGVWLSEMFDTKIYPDDLIPSIVAGLLSSFETRHAGNMQRENG